MEYLMTLDLEDWTDCEAFERMVERQGGPELALSQQHARELEKHLEMGLTREQKPWLHSAADAAIDAAGLREKVVTRVSLAHGLGVGAALARHVDEENHAPEVARLAANLVTAMLSSGLAPETALDVAETVLEVLRLADLAMGQFMETEPDDEFGLPEAPEDARP